MPSIAVKKGTSEAVTELAVYGVHDIREHVIRVECRQGHDILGMSTESPTRGKALEA